MTKAKKALRLPQAEIDAVVNEARVANRGGNMIYHNPYNRTDPIRSAAWRLGWLKERDGK